MRPSGGQIFGQNEAWNTNMFRGQETRHKGLNDRYGMNGPIVFFKKFRKPHFRPNIWPPEGQK